MRVKRSATRECSTSSTAATMIFLPLSERMRSRFAYDNFIWQRRVDKMQQVTDPAMNKIAKSKKSADQARADREREERIELGLPVRPLRVIRGRMKLADPADRLHSGTL